MLTTLEAPQRATDNPAGAALRSAAPRAPQPRGEFLTFRLGDEEYGIDILAVQEIRSYEAPTHIANTPSHVKGVVDLRGVIVPIVDLRMSLGCPTVAYDDSTVVIVLNVSGRVIGGVVDSVSDVIALQRDAIKPPPEVASSWQCNAITGIASVEGEGRSRMLILMDIAALMASPEIGFAGMHGR